MAKQVINVGTSANDGTGDPNRTAFQKINANFTELYDGAGAGDLQQVTDNGNTTTNDIKVSKLYLKDSASELNGRLYLDSNNWFFEDSDGVVRFIATEGSIFLKNRTSEKEAVINTNLLTANRTYTLPNASGTLALQTPQYKFLLSQSGGDTNPQTATSGTLTQGVTYEIVAFETGDDFIPSGAPNNTIGTKWVANGVAPTWSNGSEIGWDASNVIVSPLGNCLYDVTWQWNGGGSFLGTKIGAFPVSKTFIHNNGADGAVNVGGGSSSYFLYRIDDDTILIGTTDNSLDAFVYAPVFIEVYP